MAEAPDIGGDFKKAIADRVGVELSARKTVDHSSAQAGPPTVLSRGEVFTSTSDLVKALQRWAGTGDDATIGDVGSFGGKAWIAVDLAGERVVLNADTTRSAVVEFLDHVAANGAESTWRVVVGQRGSVNRVVYRTDIPLRGWYCYLLNPRATEGPA